MWADASVYLFRLNKNYNAYIRTKGISTWTIHRLKMDKYAHNYAVFSEAIFRYKGPIGTDKKLTREYPYFRNWLRYVAYKVNFPEEDLLFLWHQHFFGWQFSRHTIISNYKRRVKYASGLL